MIAQASALDLISLSDLGAYKARGGPERNRALVRFITAASRAIEAEVGRRLRYRGPLEVAGGANIVADTAFTAAGALAIANQPNAAGRSLVVTVKDADPETPITGGTVTIVGTVGGVPGTTVVLDLSAGLVQHTLEFFTAVTSITVAGQAGDAAADRIKVGSSLGYTELHTVERCSESWVLLPIEWPVANVLEVNEDASRTFGASTRLTAGTDYQLAVADERQMGRSSLIRLSSSLPTAWMFGFEPNKLVLTAGYSATGVPEEIRGIAERLVELLDDEISNGRLGVSARSDPSGNFTRFAAAALTPEMRRQLAAYRRRTYATETGQRYFTLEEAA
jgi:hypothetical protein